MGEFVKGDVVVLPFPFSDLSANKKRPALVMAALSGDDLVCCQITSEERFDQYSLRLHPSDFEQGKLRQLSMIRPNKLFTADRSLLLYKIGSLNKKKLKDVEDALVRIFTS